MAKKRKQIIMQVVLSVESDVGVREATRELRDRVNEHNGWLGSERDGSEWLRVKRCKIKKEQS